MAGQLAPATVNLTAASLQRNPGATANFLGNVNGGVGNLDSGVNHITISSGVSSQLVGNNGGILPFAMANSGPTTGGDFASYDFVNNSITFFNGYVTSIANAGIGDIVKEAATEILTANKTITGLLLTGGATVAEDGFTLTLGGGIGGDLGGILSTNGSNTIIGGSVNIGSDEGVLLAATGTTTTINTIVSGGSSDGGLTVSTAGTIAAATTVYLPNSNTFTGNAYLSGTAANFTLTIGSNTSLGSGTLFLTAGTLTANAAVTLANNVQLNASNVTVGGQNDITFTGNGVLANTNFTASNTFYSTLTITSTALTAFTTGILTGSGGLLIAGSGVLILAGLNTYSGGTFLTGTATLILSNNTNSGALTQGPSAPAL